MIEKIYKNISEVLPDFFNKEQIDEYILIYKDFISNSAKDVDTSDKKSSYKMLDGLLYRTQIELLITFSDYRLSREKYLSLLLYLSQVSITNGEFLTAIDINEKIILLVSEDKDMLSISANANLMIGEIHSRQAGWEKSFQFINKALEQFRFINDVKGIARCENLLGTIYGDYGDVQKAIENFESALGKSNDRRNYSDKGKIEINLGIVNTIKGLYDEALVYFKRALINYEKIGDKKRIAEIHQNIGMVYLKKEDFKFALNEFDESLSFAMETNYLQNIGIVYLSKAFVYLKIDDFSLANAFADKSLEVAHRLNDKLTVAEVYKIKGILQRRVQNYNLSENYLLTSLRLNKETANELNQAETYQELGVLYKEMGKTSKSEENFSLALQYFKKINSEPDIKNLEKLLLHK